MHRTLSSDLMLNSALSAFHGRMVLHHQSALAARLSGTNNTNLSTSVNNNSNNTASGSTTNTTTNNNNNGYRSGTIMGHQRPIIDLLVALIAVPVLILCALQLEKNLHDMTNSPESRWLVFALGVGMLIVSVIICGYVTHRMGVCIWAGPIDEAGNRIHHGRSGGGGVPHINSQNDILRIVDTLPPSYDSVIKSYDIPPPPYDCVVIDMDQCKEENIAGSAVAVAAAAAAPPPLPTTMTSLVAGAPVCGVAMAVAVVADVCDLKDQAASVDCSSVLHI